MSDNEQPEAVRQVRAWRRRVAERWEGKSFDEILADLGKTRQRFEAERALYEAEKAQKDQAS